MPGYAPDAIRGVFDQLVKLRPNWNLALGGILGDAAHFASGGYHVPRAYVSNGDYSVQLPQDKLGDPQAASALDVTPQGGTGESVMRSLTNNLRKANHRRDPRIVKVLREFAGTLDNNQVFSMDVQRGVQVWGFDSGHLWHVHISILREYANDTEALAGVAEVLAGVPLRRSKVVKPPTPTPPTPKPKPGPKDRHPWWHINHLVERIAKLRARLTHRRNRR